MNLYLLRILSRFLMIILMNLFSFFSLYKIEVKDYVVHNNAVFKSQDVMNETVEYDIIKNYTYKIPVGKYQVIEAGELGISFTDSNNETVIVKEPKSETRLVGTGARGNYIGNITAYGPDCKTCNGKGIVACSVPNKGSYNLIKDGHIYKDADYGELRILAGTREEFPCGTIMKVTNKGNTFYGIVLDRGGAMEKAYANDGTILIDLAFSTEKDPELKKEMYSVTNKTLSTKIEVERWGF